MYFQSEYLAASKTTSACVLVPCRASVPAVLLKGWREILLLPRGSVIRKQSAYGAWQDTVTKEGLRVLYLPPVTDESAAILDGAIHHAVLSAAQVNSNSGLRMMFAGRAAGTNASILFDSGASENFIQVREAKWNVC